jgi:hypothetical protein
LLAGRFVGEDVLEAGRFVAGRFVAGHFVEGCFVGVPFPRQSPICFAVDVVKSSSRRK